MRLQVKPSDLVVFSNPRVVRTKLKYKQILPADMSGWTIHCVSRERKLLTFVRMEQGEEEEMMDEALGVHTRNRKCKLEAVLMR